MFIHVLLQYFQVGSIFAQMTAQMEASAPAVDPALANFLSRSAEAAKNGKFSVFDSCLRIWLNADIRNMIRSVMYFWIV